MHLMGVSVRGQKQQGRAFDGSIIPHKVLRSFRKLHLIHPCFQTNGEVVCTSASLLNGVNAWDELSPRGRSLNNHLVRTER